MSVNRNKKSVAIDMKSSRGANLILDLARQCDVLIENFRPGTLDKYGLGYEQVRDAAPRLVYASINGYGDTGPYRDKGGYDVIAEGEGGMMHITGSADGEPSKIGTATTDLATGLYAHGAILAALLQRSTTGLGQKVVANLLSTQVAQ